eukprot:3074340-Pleurochrysis_carterae.AAC.2
MFTRETSRANWARSKGTCTHLRLSRRGQRPRTPAPAHVVPAHAAHGISATLQLQTLVLRCARARFQRFCRLSMQRLRADRGECKHQLSMQRSTNAT